MSVIGTEVLVVGAGFAGIQVARELGRRLPDRVRVTLLDRNNYHQFTPLLYQVATAGLSPDEVAVPVRAITGSSQVRTWMGEASSVDLGQRVVRLGDGAALPFDYLVLATGARSHYFGHDAWRPHLHSLEDVGAAVRLREHILRNLEAAERETDPEIKKELLTFIVIGGGPTGVELAGSLSELVREVLVRDYRSFTAADIRVLLLELSERLLSTFDPRLAERARRDLERLGVEVHVSTRVEDISRFQVDCSLGVLRARTLCWGAGVAPGAFVQQLQMQKKRGRVVVAADCRVPGHPRVFVVGDAAHLVPVGASKPLPGVAAVAIQQGRYVAQCIERDLLGMPQRPFIYRDKGQMATIGRSKAVVQTHHFRVVGLLAWVAWIVLHVWYLIDFRTRLLVLFELGWSYLRRKRGSRLITEQTSPTEREAQTKKSRPRESAGGSPAINGNSP